MFICEDESIYGMGYGLFGKDDKGWLRKIPKPDDCSDFAVDEHTGQIKAEHGQCFRIVLTKSGKMFINGHDFHDGTDKSVMKLVDPACIGNYDDCEYGQDNAITSFKELDVNGMFS